eukprot:3364180-Pyramimonas_sp.AAC.2
MALRVERENRPHLPHRSPPPSSHYVLIFLPPPPPEKRAVGRPSRSSTAAATFLRRPTATPSASKVATPTLLILSHFSVAPDADSPSTQSAPFFRPPL